MHSHVRPGQLFPGVDVNVPDQTLFEIWKINRLWPRVSARPPADRRCQRDVWLWSCAGRIATGKSQVGGQLPDQPNHPFKKTCCHEQGLSVGI